MHRRENLNFVMMFRFLRVSALLVIATGASNVRPAVPLLDGRIMGGADTDVSELPYQVSVLNYNSHICGGSIISPVRVLTAGHCTHGNHTEKLSVRAGSSVRGSGGQVIKVSKVSQHPKYDHVTLDYDVSVLFLASPLTFGTHVQPIALHPVGAKICTGGLAVVSGWGINCSCGSFSSILQKVTVAKVGDNVCQKAYSNIGNITNRMTCYGYDRGGKDSCEGDSGGPLVIRGHLVGVVSWGYGCAIPGYPGVYAKVAHTEIHDHIEKVM